MKKERTEEQIDQQGSGRVSPNRLFWLLSNILLDHFWYSFLISGKSSKSVSIRNTQSNERGEVTSEFTKEPCNSNSLPYPDDPSLCVVILCSPLSVLALRYQTRVKFSARKLPHSQWVLSPWDKGRAREVHTEPRGVCYLSSVSSSTVPHTFCSGVCLALVLKLGYTLDSPREFLKIPMTTGINSNGQPNLRTTVQTNTSYSNNSETTPKLILIDDNNNNNNNNPQYQRI